MPTNKRSTVFRTATILLPVFAVGWEFNANSQILLQPTGISATALVGGIQVRWIDNAIGEEFYRVERKVGGGGFGSYVTLVANSTNYTDTAVTPGTLYTYRVFAYAGISASPYSAEASALAINLLQPTGISAKAWPGTIQVKWTDNAIGEAFYRVERKVGGGLFFTYATIAANSTNYTDTVVTSGTLYTYRVFAYIGASASPYSAVASATATNPPSLVLSRLGSNLVFTWPTNAIGFALVYATNLSVTNWTSNSVTPVIVGGNYTVTNPVAGGNNFYRLKK